LFTIIKLNNNFIIVGVNVKSVAKWIEINSICTVFGYIQKNKGVKEIIYRDKKITPEQTALLDGLNSLSLPSV